MPSKVLVFKFWYLILQNDYFFYKTTTIQQPSSMSCKNEVARGSKLPIPVSLPEKTSSKIKATLKNLIMSQVNDEKLASLPPEPRMTRSSSLRRANSLKRFNNRNHASVNSANANTCSTNVPTPGKDNSKLLG